MRVACCQWIVCLSIAGSAASAGCSGVQRPAAVSIVPAEEEEILYACAVDAVAAEGYGLDGSDAVLRHFRTDWQPDEEGGRVRLRALVYTSDARGPGVDLSRERQVQRDGEWDAAARDPGAQAQIDAVLSAVRRCWDRESVHGDGRADGPTL